jgi:hypothetical protein
MRRISMRKELKPKQPLTHEEAGTQTTRPLEKEKSVPRPRVNGRAARLRVSLFTSRYSPDPDWDRTKEVWEAVEVAAQGGSDLLVLPGYSFGRVAIQEASVQDLVDDAGMALLAELGEVTFLF